MRLLDLFEVLLVNLVLAGLLLWITGDYSFRNDYWASESFLSSTARYPLFLITSATKGSTSIPGLLTVDWQQVIVLVLLLADAIYLRSLLRARGRSQGSSRPPLAE